MSRLEVTYNTKYISRDYRGPVTISQSQAKARVSVHPGSVVMRGNACWVIERVATEPRWDTTLHFDNRLKESDI